MPMAKRERVKLSIALAEIERLKESEQATHRDLEESEERIKALRKEVAKRWKWLEKAERLIRSAI